MYNLLAKISDLKINYAVAEALNFIRYRTTPDFTIISFIADDDPQQCIEAARIIQALIDLHPLWWQTRIQGIQMLWAFRQYQRRLAPHDAPIHSDADHGLRHSFFAAN